VEKKGKIKNSRLIMGASSKHITGNIFLLVSVIFFNAHPQSKVYCGFFNEKEENSAEGQ
jgi:hypothetical protein